MNLDAFADYAVYERQPEVWQVILEAVAQNPDITPSELMQVSGLGSDIQTELIAILAWQRIPNHERASAATLRKRYNLDAHGLTKLLIAELAKQLT